MKSLIRATALEGMTRIEETDGNFVVRTYGKEPEKNGQEMKPKMLGY